MNSSPVGRSKWKIPPNRFETGLPVTNHRGIIIDVFPNSPIVSALVLEDVHSSPYIFPFSLTIPTEEDKKRLSKSQLMKRSSLPDVGQYVHFASEGNVITYYERGMKFMNEKLDSVSGGVLCKTIGLVSPDRSRFWSWMLGEVKVPHRILREIVEDIPLEVQVKVEPHYAKNPNRIRCVEELKPTLSFSLYRICGPALAQIRTLIHGPEWNRGRNFPGMQQLAPHIFEELDEYPFGEMPPNGDYNLYLPLRTVYTTKDGLQFLPFRDTGLVIGVNEVYCKADPGQLVINPIARPNDYRLRSGSIVYITVNYEEITRRLICADILYKTTMDVMIDTDGKTLFRANVFAVSDRPFFYWHDTLGYIHDPKNVVGNSLTAIAEENFYDYQKKCISVVWVFYNPSHQYRDAKFLVRRMALQVSESDDEEDGNEDYLVYESDKCWDLGSTRQQQQ